MARRSRSPDPPPNPFEPLEGKITATLDLHGFRATEARAGVETFLREEHRRQPGGLVHIITGKGRGSERGPVLKKTVGTLLHGGVVAAFVASWGSDLDSGGYLVRLKERGR